jgi:hypothetical protein
MRDTERVPKDNVSIHGTDVRILGNPGGQTLRGLARGLWDMAAGGMDLPIIV